MSRLSSLAIVLLSLSGNIAALAEEADVTHRHVCDVPKPFREVAEDEIKTTAELCLTRSSDLLDIREQGARALYRGAGIAEKHRTRRASR